MTQQELLALLADGLEAMGIPFMVVGSHASSLHGQPRATNDIDLVIDPNAEQLEGLLTWLGDKVYVSPEAAREAFRSRSLFNVIDLAGGWKADLIMRKHRAFSIQEFIRRPSGIIGGRPVCVASCDSHEVGMGQDYALGASSERCPGRGSGSRAPFGLRLPAVLGAGAWGRRQA
jgi:hypothetical protein